MKKILISRKHFVNYYESIMPTSFFALMASYLLPVHPLNKFSTVTYLTYNISSGDTLGTMDTAEAGPFNQSQHPWFRPRTRALPLPLIAYRNGRLTIDASDLAAACKVG